jgi:replication initiator protein A
MDSGDRLLQGRKKFVRQPDGRDEFNLAEFPLTVLTDKTPSGVKTIEWEDEIIDKVTSLPIKRKVIVTGSDAFGLPTALDADVLFALVQLTKQVNNFASRDVFFSRYELLRVLDWRDEGKSYRRIEESLNRWVGTSIYFSAWRDKETETWQSEKFHILDNVTLMSNDHRKRLKARGQGDLAFSSFSWNKIVFRNLQAGFVCPVDLDIYFSLKRSISKRLFRYVGKHFRLRQQEEIAFDLKHFAFEKIGLSRSYGDAGQIKKELQPALEELEAIGFLRPAGRDERYTKIARGEWIITLVRAPQAILPPVVAEELVVEPTAAERALIARGVTPAIAAALAESFPAEHIERHVEVHDWLMARKDRRVSKSPAGYLVDSIRRGYASPKGFEAKTEADRRLREEAERARQAEEAKRREEAAEHAREAAEEARIRDYWEALTPIEQEIHKNEAIRHGNAFLVAQYRRTRGKNPEAEATYLKAILDEHIRLILDGKGAPDSVVAGPATTATPPTRATATAKSPQRTLFP